VVLRTGELANVLGGGLYAVVNLVVTSTFHIYIQASCHVIRPASYLLVLRSEQVDDMHEEDKQTNQREGVHCGQARLVCWEVRRAVLEGDVEMHLRRATAVAVAVAVAATARARRSNAPTQPSAVLILPTTELAVVDSISYEKRSFPRRIANDAYGAQPGTEL
jgi:hypothetical protein